MERDKRYVYVSSRLGNVLGEDNAAAKYAEICVKDGGCGIAQNVKGHAFEPFFTTKAVGKGSGLGLSQVYGFATQSGGYADIKSVPGAGAAVSIFIPVRA